MNIDTKPGEDLHTRVIDIRVPFRAGSESFLAPLDISAYPHVRCGSFCRKPPSRALKGPAWRCNAR